VRRRGFTLVEVLLAIALIAMLSGSVFAFLWSLVGRRDVLHGRAVEAAAGDAFINRLESDVPCAIAGDDDAGPGIVGTSASLKLLTRGVWLPASARERAAGDLQVAEYRFDASAGVLRGRRWAAGASAPEFETISDHVQRVRLRYSDGAKWLDSFNSGSAGALPVAIEVAVWFGGAGSGTSGGASASPAGGNAVRGTVQATPSASVPAPSSEPDRLRVIVVPDGPETAWKEAR
jgi:prepilin-type N-terminal cleavage/methylation domain-containing protein